MPNIVNADPGVSGEFKEQKAYGESKSIHFQVVHPHKSGVKSKTIVEKH